MDIDFCLFISFLHFFNNFINIYLTNIYVKISIDISQIYIYLFDIYVKIFIDISQIYIYIYIYIKSIP